MNRQNFFDTLQELNGAYCVIQNFLNKETIIFAWATVFLT